MRTALISIVLLCSLSLLPDRWPTAGFGWDFCNGLGFCAMALLIGLAWDSESPGRSGQVHLHSYVAVVAVVVVTAHALGYIWLDPIAIEYLKFKAPAYMLAGLAAWAVLLFVTLSGFPNTRRRIFGAFRAFRRWHLWLAIAAVGLSGWHVLGTAYTTAGTTRAVAAALLMLAVPGFALLARRRSVALFTSDVPLNPGSGKRQASGLGMFCFVLALAYAGLKSL